MKKLFIIEKHVVARNITEALKLEKGAEITNVCLDPEWRKNNLPETSDGKKIGFKE